MLKSFVAAVHSKANLKKLIDILGPLAILWTVISAWINPNDQPWLAAIVTATCFWIAVRVVVICCCGDQWWPAPGLIFLLLSMLTNHIGAFVHFRSGWGISVEREAAWNMIWAFTLAYAAFACAVWVYFKLSGLDTRKMLEDYYAKPLIFPQWQQSLMLPAGKCLKKIFRIETHLFE